MEQPKVSVIIPVYNAEPYLNQCIESVLNQSLKEIEVICVDDGSTDHSLKILTACAEKDSRLKVITQENTSAGAARNKGLEIAQGEYLSFLDADDFFEKEMLETAYTESIESDTDIIAFRSNRYDDKTGLFHEANWTIREELLPDLKVFSHKDIKKDFFIAFMGWAWDKLFKAEFIKRNSLFFQDQKSINDQVFVFSALAKAERIIINRNVFAHKRVNNVNSISTNYSYSKNPYFFYNALKELKKQLIVLQCYEELERDYINYALYYSLWNLDKFFDTEIYEDLFENLKSKWFLEFGVLDKQETYFYNPNNFKRCNEIMLLKAKEYKKRSVIRNTNCGNFLFPFELVRKNAEIVLYGAGNVGKVYYKQVKYTDYCKVSAWCDKQYQSLGDGYCDPEEIAAMEFDAIVIAVNDKDTAEKIAVELQHTGIESGKIIWRSPEIYLSLV